MGKYLFLQVPSSLSPTIHVHVHLGSALEQCLSVCTVQVGAYPVELV